MLALVLLSKADTNGSWWLDNCSSWSARAAAAAAAVGRRMTAAGKLCLV